MTTPTKSGAISRGDVVLTKFPFTDLTGSALRPALVVSHGQIGQDVVIVAISSVSRGSAFPSDYTIATVHPEFARTGLNVASVVRTHRFVTVERSLIIRKLGHVGPQIQKEVDKRLRTVLSL